MIDAAQSHGHRPQVPSFDVHSLPVAVLAFVDGKLTQANPHWSDLTGLSEMDSLGDEWLSAVHVEDRESIGSDARADGRSPGGQVRLCDVRNSSEVWVQSRVRAVGPAARPVVVVTLTEIGTLKASEADLRYRASRDTMTGLLNKGAFFDALEQSLAMSKADDCPAAVFFIDLDGFKAVNDSNGHAVGDRLLIAAADRLRTMARSSDLVGRLGGDEFAVFQMMVPAEDGDRIAERFALALSAPYTFDGLSVQITASVGVAPFVGEASPSTVVERADRAMYRAKTTSGASWAVDTHPDDVDCDHDELSGAMATGLLFAGAERWNDGEQWDARPETDAPTQWDDDDRWNDDDASDVGVSRRRKLALVLVAVIAVVLAGWATRALLNRSSTAHASSGPLPSPTVVISPPVSIGSTVTSPATTSGLVRPVDGTTDLSLERVVVPVTIAPSDASPQTTTAATTPTAVPGGRSQRPGATASTLVSDQVAPAAPLAAAEPPVAAPSATTVGSTPPLAAQEPPAAVATPVPAVVTSITGSSAAAAPPTPPVPATTIGVPSTTVLATAGGPAAPAAPAQLAPSVHVVAVNEGPDQVATWFASIGEGRLYGHTKALHQPLPAGTTITVSHGSVVLQQP
jgi:diguanylate cyclase (GGDEF)-like protein